MKVDVSLEGWNTACAKWNNWLPGYEVMGMVEDQDSCGVLLRDSIGVYCAVGTMVVDLPKKEVAKAINADLARRWG